MERKKIVKIAIIIILVVIIGVIAYLIIPKDNKNTSKVVEDSTIEEGQQQYSQINLENTENAKVENGQKINTSEKLLQEKNIDGIVIKDIKLVAQNGTTSFTATVQNNTSKKIDARKITIQFKNKEDIVYASLNSYLGDIEIGKTGNINASTTQDLANAYDFTIDFNK